MKKYLNAKVKVAQPGQKNSADSLKVRTLQADAADETATASVREQALGDEGRLDVFLPT